MVQAAFRSNTPNTLHPDCMAVVSGWLGGAGFACRPDSRGAGLWRQAFHFWFQKDALPFREVLHTKAHRTEAQATAAGDSVNFFGNAFSDRGAKRGAMLHGPSPADTTLVKVAYRSWLRVARVAAGMLAAWPRIDIPKCALNGVRAQRDRAPLVNPRPHTYIWEGNRWVCKICLRFKVKVSSPLDAFPCVEFPPIFKQIRDSLPKTKHDIRVTQVLENGPLGAFCLKCGLFAFQKPLGLLEDCRRGALSKGTFHRLRRMRRGLHPTSCDRLALPWRMATVLESPQADGAPRQSIDIPSPPVLPSSSVAAVGSPPVFQWDVQFPEGLDFIEEDCEDS